MKNRFWIMFVAVFSFGAAVFFVLNKQSDAGRSEDGHGDATWGEVLSREPGRCSVGVKLRHCWLLALRWPENAGGPAHEARITLTLEDHLSAQVLPGRRVPLRLVGQEARLDIRALESGVAPP